MEIIKQKQNEINELKMNPPKPQNQDNIQKLIKANAELNTQINSLRNRLRMAESNQQAPQSPSNNQELMELIKRQQAELNELKQVPKESANSKQLIKMIKEQQAEINELRLDRAGKSKNDELLEMLKTKQDEINRLNMRARESEELLARMAQKDKQISVLKQQVGSGQTVDKLMTLLNEKQSEINQMRLARGSVNGNESALRNQLNNKTREVAQLQDELNQTRKGESQQTEELIRLVQAKQDEINKMKTERAGASGQTADQARMEIEFRNEISRLRVFEKKSKKLEEHSQNLQRQIQTMKAQNPEMADRQRLAEIIENQQNKINSLMKQAGGRDWAAEVEKREDQIQRLKPENERLRRTMKEIQNVNNTNKVNIRTLLWRDIGYYDYYLEEIDFKRTLVW